MSLTNKTPAASLKRLKWGLGVAILVKVLYVLINMPFVAVIITVIKIPF